MLKVLIAEDNVLIADMLEYFLNSEGYDVCGIAATVDEAVALADLHKPDLAVLDFRLDGGYGSKIRARTKDKDSMKILFVSGDVLGGKLTPCEGEAYIQKPYGMKDVSSALRIIQKMNAGGFIPPSEFPKGFHLVHGATDQPRKTA